MGIGLKEAAAIRGDSGNEEGADFLRRDFGHAAKVAYSARDAEDYEGAGPARAKAPFPFKACFYGLKAVASTVASRGEARMHIGFRAAARNGSSRAGF